MDYACIILSMIGTRYAKASSIMASIILKFQILYCMISLVPRLSDF